MDAVSNAFPIITLAKAGMLGILSELFDKLVVTNAVVQEVRAGGENDPGSKALSQLTWIEHVLLEPPLSRLSVINLGSGEAETIEWALRNPDYMAILDDRAARRTAEALGVRCAGTLRLVYEARQRGLTDSFHASVEALQDAGLYCDRKVIDAIIQER